MPARASSPGCSARMIVFASPPSEAMLEAPGVGREPSFKGACAFGAGWPLYGSPLAQCGLWGRDHHGAAGAPRRCLTAQSPINAISRPAEAAAAVSTTATARVRKCGPWRRQLEGSGGRDARSCTRCAVGSKLGGRAMGCTSVVARARTIRAGMCVNHLSDLTGSDSGSAQRPPRSRSARRRGRPAGSLARLPCAASHRGRGRPWLPRRGLAVGREDDIDVPPNSARGSMRGLLEVCPELLLGIEKTKGLRLST